MMVASLTTPMTFAAILLSFVESRMSIHIDIIRLIKTIVLIYKKFVQ